MGVTWKKTVILFKKIQIRDAFVIMLLSFDGPVMIEIITGDISERKISNE